MYSGYLRSSVKTYEMNYFCPLIELEITKKKDISKVDFGNVVESNQM